MLMNFALLENLLESLKSKLKKQEAVKIRQPLVLRISPLFDKYLTDYKAITALIPFYLSKLLFT